MHCSSALHSQIITLLTVPHEIILLQHTVFREYAKIAVGPDFIHTFPSFIILIALTILFWKNPPTFKWVHEDHIQMPAYKVLQMLLCWVCVNAILWLWLVFQRVLYCIVWANWSYETEYREFIYPWWQRVWSSYYPQTLHPPLFSAAFISWILAMVIATCILGCAVSIRRMRLYFNEASAGVREMNMIFKAYLALFHNKLREATETFERTTILDETEMTSTCDDCRSVISTDEKNYLSRRDVYPISNGTDWYSMTDERKNSLKSMRTSKTITGEFPEEPSFPNIFDTLSAPVFVDLIFS
ncbi:uncharacterized protein LOC117181635 isoform X2 [Belonocnema kinseyi]|uniref:uncharacterized protein LOC117181635 isoform X2 n=1 Tax=Belonocnema kinseyi TaxID=2817044 RepID=UPI00143DD067|nr:uncharacterized protein LOC117181635 isoform X2 [Belonocnema kinseyi]